MTHLALILSGLSLGLFVAYCDQTHRLTTLQHDVETNQAQDQGAGIPL